MDWNLVLVTPPTAEPLSSAADVVAQARLGSLQAEDGALLEGYIRAARERCEEVSWRQLLTATWDLRLTRFPDACDVGEQVVRASVSGPGIYLPRPPLRSVTSITYVDADGVTQTLDVSRYQVEPPAGTGDERALIVPAYGYCWPTTRCQPGSVVVRFDAGYGAAGSSVPGWLRFHMGRVVAAMYQQREDVADSWRSMADRAFYAARAW